MTARDGVLAHRSADGSTHLAAGVDWLMRAQDATGNGALARAHPLGGGPDAASNGARRACPETTGRVIPTFYLAAQHLGRPDLAQRAGEAARWGVEMQLPSGAARGGVVGTGQALLGWVAAFSETGWGVFAGASRRARRNSGWQRRSICAPWRGCSTTTAGCRMPASRSALAGLRTSQTRFAGCSRGVAC